MIRSRQVRVLFIGVSRGLPTFIARRVSRLAQAEIKLSLLVFREHSLNHPDTVDLIIKEQMDNGFVSALKSISMVLTTPRLFLRLWQISTGTFAARVRWCFENHSFAKTREVDIIHAQWFLEEDTLRLIREFFPGLPLVISARGSQLTVKNYLSSGLQPLRSNFSQASRLVCVSKDMAHKCLELGASGEKLLVNYNGIDLIRFGPAGPSQSSESRILNIISVGAVIWRKAYVFQLLIIKELLKLGVESRLEIIGEGDRMDEMKYLIHRMELGRVVNLRGRMTEEEVIVKLQQSDVYLSTSSAEGLANSLVEAAACGLPIVAFECEGVYEVVVHKETGFVLPFGDVISAANAIVSLKSADVRDEFGRRARVHAELFFDEEKWVREMITFYKGLTSK